MRILIVEDHKVVASGLQMGLESEGHDVTISDGSDPVRGTFDVVLLDLNLGDRGSGLDLMGSFAETPVVVLTGETDTAVLASAYDAGVKAVLDKSVPFDRLLRQLAAVAAGDDLEASQRRHEILGRRIGQPAVVFPVEMRMVMRVRVEIALGAVDRHFLH